MTKKYHPKRKKRTAARYVAALLLLAAAAFVLYRVTVAALPLNGTEPTSGTASLVSQEKSEPASFYIQSANPTRARSRIQP